MAKITATGIPAKYPGLGKIRVTIEGTDTGIDSITFEEDGGDAFVPAPHLEDLFDMDMENGPTLYTPCQEPETIGYALAILCEWYGGYKTCWEHIQVDGDIVPPDEDDDDPDVIY